RANSSGSLFENGATANDTALETGTLLVTLPARPDLQVETVTAPAKPSAGDTVSVEFTVINQGTVAANGRWTDRVYLALDDRVSGDDILVDTLANGAALGPGERYRSASQTFTIPERFRGTAFVLVVADADNAIDEYPNDGNNVFAERLDVTPLPPADLVTG